MHRPSRFHRSLTALLAVLALLWSQLALAVYVCPGVGVRTGAPTMVERMAAGEPCDGIADSVVTGQTAQTAQTALCHQHCTNAPQSAGTPQPPLPTLPVLVQAWPVPQSLAPVVSAPDALPAAHKAGTVAPRPPPNPLFLASLRVRV